MTGEAGRPTRGRTCAVVVTRDPPPGLEDRLAAVRRQVGRLVVVDNASSRERARRLRARAEEAGFELVRNERNRGVAAALNQGVGRAAEEGTGWALLLDQDSRPSPRLRGELAEIHEACPFRARVAVIGTNHRDPATGRVDRGDTDPERGWEERHTVITAGSLLSLPAFRELGPFREDLFVDQVDHEYCLRARRAGYRVVASTRPLLEQPVGDAVRRRLPWGAVVTTNHPPGRRYYMVRNHLVLAREYAASEPAWVVRTLAARTLMALRVLCFEPRRPAQLAAMARGAWHGLAGRLGPGPYEAEAGGAGEGP